jgi:hypothetical protein
MKKLTKVKATFNSFDSLVKNDLINITGGSTVTGPGDGDDEGPIDIIPPLCETQTETATQSVRSTTEGL